jgi:F420H(2)-dependent quinone reductase
MNKGSYLDVADRSWPVLRRVMVLHTFAYRATNGRIGRRIPGVPAPILLLVHVGAKSGVKRTSPLSYIADGDDVVLIAAKGGYAKHPAWLHNLKANPDRQSSR